MKRAVALTMSLLAFAVLADEPKPETTIAPTRAPRNVFGGQEAEFQFTIESAKAIKGRVTWKLAAGTATVTSGETDLNAGPGAAGKANIKLAVPPVKDGVIFSMKLTVAAIEAGQTKPSAEYECDVHSFPKDPFFERGDWLKKLKLALYDTPGHTGKLLTAANVAFEEVRTIEALGELKDGVLIVGEGTSFKEERGLGAALEKLAGAGIVVLCLAPADGELALPGLAGPRGEQSELLFRRDILHTLDKRLDPAAWTVEPKTAGTTVGVKAVDGAATGDVSPTGGWNWVEARSKRGRWAVCGHAVVSRWETGPAPRFAFIRMLEYLTDPDFEKPKKETER